MRCSISIGFHGRSKFTRRCHFKKVLRNSFASAFVPSVEESLRATNTTVMVIKFAQLMEQNVKVSDGSQPPMMSDSALSGSVGSRSLDRLVRHARSGWWG